MKKRCYLEIRPNGEVITHSRPAKLEDRQSLIRRLVGRVQVFPAIMVGTEFATSKPLKMYTDDDGNLKGAQHNPRATDYVLAGAKHQGRTINWYNNYPSIVGTVVIEYQEE
jgi:hypothetical protein